MTTAHGYDLPSIAVSSAHDTPAVVHTVPVDLENRDSGIAMLEGGFGLPTRLCRFVRASGLIAVQLCDPLPDTMVVTLRLTSDAQAEEWWLRRREIRATSARLRGVSTTETLATTRGLHRFLRVGAQGRLKAHVLLDDPDAAGVPTTVQQVAFTCRRDELDESRLLMVSFLQARTPPDWDRGRQLPDPLIGVKAAWLRVRAGDGATPVGSSTGRQGKQGWQPWSPDIGYAAVNRSGGRVRLLVSGKEPAARRLRRRAAPDWPSAVEIWEEGTLRRLDLPSPGRDGICAVELPGDGPALVRFPELLDEAGGWRIRVVPIED